MPLDKPLHFEYACLGYNAATMVYIVTYAKRLIIKPIAGLEPMLGVTQSEPVGFDKKMHRPVEDPPNGKATRVVRRE